jgi:hypothetical protein
MSERLNLFPDAAFEGLQSTLKARMAHVGAEIQAEQFAPLLDPLLRRIVKQGFEEAGAHEGTLWLVDVTGEFLVPVFNTGPHASAMVGKFKQPLSAGLISMVFATEQSFMENEVSRNAQQSKLLDNKLQLQTHAMIAVPFHLLNICRGVVSCVQLKTTGASDPPGFRPEHLAGVQATAALLSRLVEYRLLSRIVGWDCERC